MSFCAFSCGLLRWRKTPFGGVDEGARFFYNGVMMNSMQKLQIQANEFGPLCVGLDTDSAYIPQNIVRSIGSATEAVFLYNQGIIRGIKDLGVASCVKVQIAFYEALGLRGLEVYSRTLKLLRQEGILSIADIKRGDIASTAAAYAHSHLGAGGDFEADIVTLNPYMGRDTIEPFEKYFAEGKGAFALLCTSNKGAADIELKKSEGGTYICEAVAKIIESVNEKYLSASGDALSLGPLGAVVGATQVEVAAHFRKLCKDTFFLIPGFGAQGGDVATIKTLLSDAGGVVNSSRGILCAWQSDAELALKREEGTLTLMDITQSALKAATRARNILLGSENGGVTPRNKTAPDYALQSPLSGQSLQADTSLAAQNAQKAAGTSSLAQNLQNGGKAGASLFAQNGASDNPSSLIPNPQNDAGGYSSLAAFDAQKDNGTPLATSTLQNGEGVSSLDAKSADGESLPRVFAKPHVSFKKEKGGDGLVIRPKPSKKVVILKKPHDGATPKAKKPNPVATKPSEEKFYITPDGQKEKLLTKAELKGPRKPLSAKVLKEALLAVDKRFELEPGAPVFLSQLGLQLDKSGYDLSKKLLILIKERYSDLFITGKDERTGHPIVKLR